MEHRLRVSVIIKRWPWVGPALAIILTKEIIIGEGIIFPDLNHQARVCSLLLIVKTPEMLLKNNNKNIELISNKRKKLQVDTFDWIIV